VATKIVLATSAMANKLAAAVVSAGANRRVIIADIQDFRGQRKICLANHYKFGAGIEFRIARHVGLTEDLSFGVIDGPKNNFGMFRSGVNFVFSTS